MPRLFIASFIAPEDQARLATLQNQTDKLESMWKRKVRWVAPQKLHLTWVFLGNVEDGLIEPISDMLGNLVVKQLGTKSRKPLSVSFERPEIWPDQRKPRQIVVTAPDVAPDVMALGNTLRTGLLEFYLDHARSEEHHRFRPHLTIMRLERREARSAAFPRPAMPRLRLSDIEGMSDALPVVLGLNKICLVESHLGRGSTYQVLHEVALPAAPSDKKLP